MSPFLLYTKIYRKNYSIKRKSLTTIRLDGKMENALIVADYKLKLV